LKNVKDTKIKFQKN